jgi:hypothetical protein
MIGSMSMSNPGTREPSRRTPLGRRNIVLLGAALLTVIAGYAVLQAGSPTLAAALLVLGYCVLFPVGIAL